VFRQFESLTHAQNPYDSGAGLAGSFSTDPSSTASVDYQIGVNRQEGKLTGRKSRAVKALISKNQPHARIHLQGICEELETRL